MKRIWYAVILIVVIIVSLGLTRWTVTARAAQAKPGTPLVYGIHGLPINGPVRTPIKPPQLTRDQLVTHGHGDDKEEIADLFYAYVFYHDTHNGPGVASLFTDDGILETLYNNGGKQYEPNAGPNGRGCLSYGHDEIAAMFGTNALPFVGHSHNQVTNVLIAVNGDTATLLANWTTIRSNVDPATPIAGASPPNNAVVSHNGEYIADLRKTSDGWRFVHHRAVEDEPAKFGTAKCEENVVGHE